MAFFNACQDALAPEKWEQCLEILAEMETDPLKGYTSLHNLFKFNLELQEMTLDLLEARHAVQLGGDIYRAYTVRERMKKFYR